MEKTGVGSRRSEVGDQKSGLSAEFVNDVVEFLPLQMGKATHIFLQVFD